MNVKTDLHAHLSFWVFESTGAFLHSYITSNAQGVMLPLRKFLLSPSLTVTFISSRFYRYDDITGSSIRYLEEECQPKLIHHVQSLKKTNLDMFCQ